MNHMDSSVVVNRSQLVIWLAGMRPRTLPAALAPVIAGTGVAAAEADPYWTRAALALVVALALQIGVNFANDYSDGTRGTDTERVGPVRLVASQLVPARSVLTAALCSFAVAAVAGLALVANVGAWWLLALGAAAIVAAWTYTGGRRPYGYRALGEVGVFVFFGLFAVMGTAFVQTQRVSWLALLVAIAIGFLACALLMVNNIRDIVGDEKSDKRTLAVVIGERRARWCFAGLVVLPFGIVFVIALAYPWVLLALLAAILVAPALRVVLTGAHGLELIPVLRDIGRTELLFGVLLAAGLFIG